MFSGKDSVKSRKLAIAVTESVVLELMVYGFRVIKKGNHNCQRKGKIDRGLFLQHW